MSTDLRNLSIAELKKIKRDNQETQERVFSI